MTDWDDFYGELFADLYLDRSPGELRDPVELLCDTIGLTGRVLDQGCGVGDLSRALSSEGLSVVGMDRNRSYVQTARERTAEDGPSFLVGDFSQPLFKQETFDGVINWYTSFGHSPDDAANQAVLDQAAATLRPGGWFVLDYSNLNRLRHDFEPVRSETRMDREGREWTVTRKSALDDEQMTDETWIFEHDETALTRHGGIRRYEHDDLMDMLEQAGLTPERVYGSYEGDEYDPAESRRLIIAARR